MKIATWSVNSVRKRLPYLCHWLRERQPDIVALQKIRVSCKQQEKFPSMEIERAGYHIEALFGDHELSSVAILIRRKFLGHGLNPEVRQRGLSGWKTDGRFLTVETDRVRISSVYVPLAPCGDSTQDQVRRSIQAKVKWLGCLTKCVADQHDTSKPAFLCGDFNVVMDGESEPDGLNRSPEVRGALTALCALGFVDLYRDLHRDGRPGFNSGTPIYKQPNARLHLILGTTNVAPHVKSACVDLEYRRPIEELAGEKWAPGAPVIVKIDDNAT